MRLKKNEPKAPRLSTSTMNACLYVEAGTRDMLYSVCGDGENPNDAIKRLVQEFQVNRYKKGEGKIQTVSGDSAQVPVEMRKNKRKSAPTGTRTRV